MLESMIAIQKNISVEDIDISEQEFEECGSAESRNTCFGVDNASPINRVINCGGQKLTGVKLFSEKSYPYDVKQNLKHIEDCKYNKKQDKDVIANVKGVKGKNGRWQVRHLLDKTERGLKSAVQEIGPVSVGMSWPSPIRIKSDGPDVKCNKTIGGHAAVVIGWGSDKEGEYWLVKSSWGEGWPPHPEKGEGKGVGKMSKYLGLACGIASTGVTADIA